MVTLGGGVVLDNLPSVPRQKDISNFVYLRERKVEDINLLIISELQKQTIVRESNLLEFSCWVKREIDAALKLLIQDGRCGKLGEYVYETRTMANVAEKVSDYVKTRLGAKGGLKGVSLDEIMEGLTLEREVAEVVVNFQLKNNQLQIENDLYKPSELESELPPAIRSACNKIMVALKKEPFTPPPLAFWVSKGRAYKEAIGHLLKTNEIHKCGAEFIFLESSWNEIESFIVATLENKNELKIGELRDRFDFSRKYAIPILEETDRIKLTKRQGDIRVKGENFENR
jgi:selenocysteine-specific elongation factor